MADTIIRVRLEYRQRRADAIIQEAVAKLRRAPKSKREPMFVRYCRRMAAECLRVL